MAASTCVNTPEISDRARHSMSNRETDPVESLCFPHALTRPHPMCKTLEELFLDGVHRACTATVFLPASKCFGELLRDFRVWAKPSISESDPKHLRALLHMRSRSVK